MESFPQHNTALGDLCQSKSCKSHTIFFSARAHKLLALRHLPNILLLLRLRDCSTSNTVAFGKEVKAPTELEELQQEMKA